MGACLVCSLPSVLPWRCSGLSQLGSGSVEAALLQRGLRGEDSQYTGIQMVDLEAEDTHSWGRPQCPMTAWDPRRPSRNLGTAQIHSLCKKSLVETKTGPR